MNLIKVLYIPVMLISTRLKHFCGSLNITETRFVEVFCMAMFTKTPPTANIMFNPLPINAIDTVGKRSGNRYSFDAGIQII